MKHISSALDRVITNVHQKLLDQEIILPVRVGPNIQIGSATIIPKGPIKNIEKDGYTVFAGITLNKVAIYLATQTALGKDYTLHCSKVVFYDQKYGVYLEEANSFKFRYKQALNKKDYEKADIFYARYQHAREKADAAKKALLALIPYNEIMNKYITKRNTNP